MCGIAGLVGSSDPLAAADAVQAMVGALRRRGPDGEGLERWPEAVLGHRRLAIFDLSALGRQPMLSPDGSIGVVFNGAIYNFHQLRSDLVARGCAFRSQTDTEVLVHGYAEWGIDGLVSRLRGMFAFGVWDERRRRLFLVRDRLGVKPLFYVSRGGMLAFASTARALRAGGLVEAIDEAALTEYLEFGYVTDGRCIYRGAAKIAAATILEWSPAGVRTRQSWAPPPAAPERTPFDECVDRAEELLVSAVEKRLQADVPVGALLSGGIDSSLVCWAIAKLGGRVTAYTVGTPGDPWDETADARQTARELGIAHEVRDLQPGDEPDIDALVAAYGEPFACASALGLLRISQAISSSATVLLTGDGGDDVFLGYPEHRHLWAAQRLARALPAGQWWESVRDSVPRAGGLRRAVTFMDFATAGLGGVIRAHDGLPRYRAAGLLGERLEHATLEQRSVPASHESARRVLADFLEYDRGNRFVGEYMTKVDGATMYHALEARSPFLDQELWEFAAALPFEVRLRGGRSKAVLRQLARRRLNARIARGRKRGFGIPVQRWLAGRWQSAVREKFEDPLFEREGWIRGEAARRELDAAARRGWAPNQLWYLFVLESWLRFELRERTPTAQKMFA